MSQERKIDFSRWPRQDAAQETGRPVPYLDIFAARPKIDSLFSLGGKYELIARSTLQTIKGREKAGWRRGTGGRGRWLSLEAGEGPRAL